MGTYEVLESVEELDTLALSVALGRGLLGLANHAINLLLAGTALLVGNSNRLGLTTVRVNRINK